MSDTKIEKLAAAYEAMAAHVAANPVSAAYRALLLDLGAFVIEWLNHLGADTFTPEITAALDERRRVLVKRLRETPMDEVAA